MKDENRKVVFMVTAVFCAVVTVICYIWGAELCEMFPVPGYAAKVEMVKLLGPIVTACSAFLAFK